MNTLSKIGKKIKVVFTQIIAFILSFLKEQNIIYVKKVVVNKKIDNKEIKKDEKKESVITNIADTTTPIPDENPTKKETSLTYKQSIANVSNDIKDKVINRIKGKEIYFSEYIVLNTIIESIEEKYNFDYKDISDDNKEKLKLIIDSINGKISPSLKREMNNNRIKTKEELKDNISHKIENLYTNKIKDILIKEKKKKEKQPIKEEPIIEKEPIKEEVIIEEPIIKKEIIDEKPITEDNTVEPLITIEREEKIITPKEDNKEDLITVEKIDKDEKVYFIADMLNTQKELDNKKKSKIDTNNAIIEDADKSIGIALQNKVKNIPFIMVPTDNKEEDKTNISDKIKTKALTGSLIIPSIIPKEETKEETKEEIIIEEKPSIKTTDNYEEKIKEAINNTKKDIEERLEEISTTEEKKEEPIINVIETKEEVEKDIEHLEEDILKIKEVKDRISDTNDEDLIIDHLAEKEEDKKYIDEIKQDMIDEDIKEEIDIVKEDIPDINSITDNTKKLISETKKEINKEEIEDKDYNKYEKEINSLLYDLELFTLKNTNLSKDEKESIDKNKNQLLDIKEKLLNQKEIDIENEKKDLEEKITEDEINRLKQEIKKLHLEHQVEVDNDLLIKLQKIENNNNPKLEEIEKNLIKKKLKRTSKILEIPSLLALPFVKNKYFFFFTIGMFVNNHFDFINAIFRRKEKKYEEIDLTPIKNGKNALEESIELTYRNIVYLDVIEEEAISKHPSLKDDEEFQKYITKIRNKLNKNYEKLEKKHKMINTYIYNIEYKNKILKKYKLIKDEDK